MIHTKTLGNEVVGPRVIYQNKANQFLETFYQETAATKSWNRVENKRRVVCPLRMSEELRDPAIKLFGRTISFPRPDLFSGSRDDDDLGSQTSSNAAVYHDNKDTSGEEELPTCENEVESSDPTEEASEDNEEKEEDQEKTLKRPDKILPCPRCNSMDTKFCYYNNYNVNQPRHFCKNCQRYWTAGGSMRNVPVGSGRRKNKSACSSQYRHIMGTDHCPKAHGTVLTFGPKNPLCESMASAFDLAERSSSNSNSTEPDSRNYQGFVPVQHAPPPFPCPQWPYPSFPAAYYPTPPYWGCVAPGPWLHQPQPHSFSDHSGYGPGPDSPTLGKHGRTILVPKTLRIDDPKEAAKSSIWSTLGIKNECINGERLFKSAFPGKGKGNSKMHVDDTSLIMQANPAAFSRSQCFHEST